MDEIIKDTSVEESTENKENDGSVESTDDTIARYEALIQDLQSKNAGLKKAVDKATGEASNFKKQLRAKQTEEEVAEAERLEKQKELESAYATLLKEKQVSTLTSNFQSCGFTKEDATKSAEYMLNGDHEQFFKLMGDTISGIVKQKESEWIASRPEVKSGGGNGDDLDPFLKGLYGK